jgi:hypothetical protein
MIVCCALNLSGFSTTQTKVCPLVTCKKGQFERYIPGRKRKETRSVTPQRTRKSRFSAVFWQKSRLRNRTEKRRHSETALFEGGRFGPGEEKLAQFLRFFEQPCAFGYQFFVVDSFNQQGRALFVFFGGLAELV